MQRFNGKTVLITGGNSGIGFATAKRVVSEGGRVIITGRDETTLNAAIAELGSAARAIRADVSQTSEIARMYDDVAKHEGKIDGVFANAGIAKFVPTSESTEADYESMFGTNVRGLFFTMQKAVPFLKDGGSVVVNASVAASRGTPHMGLYGATKAAARSLVRTFANENLARKLRFNAVSPGPIDTPIWGGDEAGKAKKAETNPMKRFGRPEEVAAAVAFLLSDDSTYTTGGELFVDGGINQL